LFSLPHYARFHYFAIFQLMPFSASPLLTHFDTLTLPHTRYFTSFRRHYAFDFIFFIFDIFNIFSRLRFQIFSPLITDFFDITFRHISSSSFQIFSYAAFRLAFDIFAYATYAIAACHYFAIGFSPLIAEPPLQTRHAARAWRAANGESRQRERADKRRALMRRCRVDAVARAMPDMLSARCAPLMFTRRVERGRC
jgi:hypothetical protein